MSVHYLVFDRGLQQPARSFLEHLFQKRLLFIFSSLIKRDHFTLWHWRILSFWRPRVRPPLVSFFVTERMRLFSVPHPQLSVIPLLDRALPHIWDLHQQPQYGTCNVNSSLRWKRLGLGSRAV
jgi:hypothetical protein